jgi:hypothetical protein
MSEILDVPAEHLGEKAHSVGRSVGYLRLGGLVKSAEAIKLQPDEAPPHHG